MAEIDSLSISIAASAEKANKSINSIITSLGKLSNALKIDTSGLENIGKNIGLGEVSKQIKTVSENIGSMGTKLSQSMRPVQEQAGKVAKTLEQMTAQYADLGKGFELKGSTAYIQKQIDNLSNSLSKANLKKQELEASGEISGKTYEYAIRDAIKYANQIESLTNQLAKMKSEQPKFAFDISGIEKAKETIESAGESIRESVALPESAFNYNAEAMAAVFGEAAVGIQNYSQAVEKFGQNAGKVLNESIQTENIEEKLKLLKIPEIKEENLNKLQNSLAKTEAKLEKLRANLANGLTMGRITQSIDDKGFVRLREQIALAEKESDALRSKIGQLQDTAKNTQGTDKLKSSISGIQTVAKAINQAFSKVLSVLKRLEKGIRNVILKIGKAIKSMFSLKSATEKSNTSFSGGLKTILKYSLGIRSLYALFNKLRNAIKEGMKNLVQYSEETNTSISLLNNSLMQLKNASAAMASPLLNAFAPALNQIIQLVIKATNYINQLLSTLMGKSTWIRAKELTDSWADSIKKAGKAANAAIRPFDELKVISMPSGGVAGEETAAEDMFETLPIESKFEQLANKIKDIADQIFTPFRSAWENQEQFVMDSWKYGLAEIGILAKSAGNDFLSVWNQPETISILDNILIIIGDIGIAVGKLADNFKAAWSASETGKTILQNIRDIFGIIVDNVKNAASYTIEWAANIDFSPLLESFKNWSESLKPAIEGISGILLDFYEQVLLPLGKWTLEKGLPELLDVFTEFNEKVDWSALRGNLAEFWTHLEPFAETVGEGLIIFVGKISDAIADFTNSDSFTNFLDNLGEWMDSIAPEDIENGIVDGLKKLTKAIIGLEIAIIGLTALKGLAELVDIFTKLAPLIGVIGEALSSLKIVKMFSMWSEGAYTLGESFMATFGVGGIIVASLAAVAAGLAYVYNKNEEVRESFSQATSAIRDGLQPALEFYNDTLLPGLQAGWDRILEVLKPLTDFVEGVFTSIWQDMINPALTYIGETVLPMVTGAFRNLWNKVLVPLGSFLADVLEPVIKIVSDVLSMLWQNVVVPLAKAIGNILGKAFEALVDTFNFVVDQIQPVIKIFQFLWDNVLKPIVNYLWDTLKPVFEEVFSAIGGLIDGLGKIFGGLIDFISGVFTGNWEKAWNGIKDIFKGVWNGIVSIVEGVINIIIKGINNFLSKFDGIADAFGSIIGIDINIPQIPELNLPKFAKGALAMKHTFAEIGEMNRPEAVLPLTDTKAMRVIADSILENASYGGETGYGESYGGGTNDLLLETRKQNQLLEQQNQLLQAILSKPNVGDDYIVDTMRTWYGSQKIRMFGESAILDPILG